jgi:hypothetical protein
MYIYGDFLKKYSQKKTIMYDFILAFYPNDHVNAQNMNKGEYWNDKPKSHKEISIFYD